MRRRLCRWHGRWVASTVLPRAVRFFAFVLRSAFLSALNVIKMVLINTPFVHVYVTRSAHLQSLTLTRKLSSGHLAPGRPAVLALMRRRRRQRRWSGGSRVDLLTLSSQRLCIRRETPTDVRHQTQSHTTTRTPRHPPPRPKPRSLL